MAYDCMIKFIVMVKKKIKIMSDNDREFTSTKFRELLDKIGIIHQFSYPYTPNQNARVERKHRQLLEVVRVMHFQGRKVLPFINWGECISAATYIINRIPSKVLKNKTPYEALNNEKPLKYFGCLCLATTEFRKHKFSPMTFKGVFMGDPSRFKGWLVVLNLEENRFYITRNVIFKEIFFPFKKQYQYQIMNKEKTLHFQKLTSMKICYIIMIF